MSFTPLIGAVTEHINDTGTSIETATYTVHMGGAKNISIHVRAKSGDTGTVKFSFLCGNDTAAEPTLVSDCSTSGYDSVADAYLDGEVTVPGTSTDYFVTYDNLGAEVFQIATNITEDADNELIIVSRKY